MERRTFLHAVIGGAACTGAAPSEAAGPGGPTQGPVPLLANDYVTVYRSPDPMKVYAYSPGLARLADGRLVATMDQGGKGVKALPEANHEGDNYTWRGKVYMSDDHGRTWTHRTNTPLTHARPFQAGASLYVLGHSGRLGIMRSGDGGETWGEPAWLTESSGWHQAPCNVHYSGGRVYLVMERKTDPGFRGWAVAVVAPVLMSADINADLTKPEAWTFSNELSFREAVEQAGKPHLVGTPFHTPGLTAPFSLGDKRYMAPLGWLETNVVQFSDPNHVWHDPSGRTFHLWMRAHTGGTNMACIAKVVEAEDGALTVSLENAPSGEPILYVPCPGGQMKFHILYDEPTGLFWLLSSQATDSMTRPSLLPPDRYNLPNNERHRLVLHFSKNCMDWCFAARVADSGHYGQGRHYASMVIDGDDLHVLSRSGDEHAKNAHDGNIITFHTVPGFRKLVY